MSDYQEDRVQANMELARRMEAMMRERTPEQSTLFLARIIANLDDTSLGYLRIAFDFAEGLLPDHELMTTAEALREIRQETGEEEPTLAEIVGRGLDTDDPGYFIL